MKCDDCIYLGMEFPHLAGERGFEVWHDCGCPLPYYATQQAVPIGEEVKCQLYTPK